MRDCNSWPKIIMHVDMDAYFAAVEQRDHPAWRKKPVVVISGSKGSSIIARSYEARRYGINTGMKLAQAYRLCPSLIRCCSRPHVYTATAQTIISYLETITPDLEVFSIDEAFLDLSHCRHIYHSITALAHTIRTTIHQLVGVTCSVGVSGDRTTAKWASKQNKPNGVKVIAPHCAQKALSHQLVTELCGINKGVARFLAQYNVYYCGDMHKIPMHVLSQRFGNIGRRIWLMCQGLDPIPVKSNTAPPKSVGHGKVMPPNSQDSAIILSYLATMADKVAGRLRANHLYAQRYFIGLRTQYDWWTEKVKTVVVTNDQLIIYRLAKRFFLSRWQGEGIYQCQITALSPVACKAQGDFFDNDRDRDRGLLNDLCDDEYETNTVPDNKKTPISTLKNKKYQMQCVKDDIRQRFGHHSMTHAVCLASKGLTEVISPAWKPKGLHQTIKS